MPVFLIAVPRLTPAATPAAKASACFITRGVTARATSVAGREIWSIFRKKSPQLNTEHDAHLKQQQ